MEKLTRTARVLDKALVITQIVVTAIAAIVFAAMSVGAIAAGGIVDVANQSRGSVMLTSGVVKLWLREPVLSAGEFRLAAIAALVITVVMAAMALIAVHLFRGIVGDMKEGNPFSPEMPGRVRRVAYLIFVYALVTPLLPLTPAYLTFRIFDVERVLSASPLVERVQSSFSYVPNILALIIGFAVILLSLVFGYGVTLQRESDETL